MKKSKGFTLIELMVVIAIIAILALLASALFRTAQLRARDSRRTSDLKAIQKVLEQNYDALTNTYPDIGTLTGEFAGGALPQDPLGGDYGGLASAGDGDGAYSITADQWEGTPPAFNVVQEKGT